MKQPLDWTSIALS